MIKDALHHLHEAIVAELQRRPSDRPPTTTGQNKRLSHFLHAVRQRLHYSHEEFLDLLASRLGNEHTLAEALLEGELPESALDDELLYDVAYALDYEPEALWVALERTQQVFHPSPAPSTDRIGEVIGRRYRLLGRIGEGGMGLVYSALDRLVGDVVALKLINTFRLQTSASPDMAASHFALALTHEFSLLASLRHPHIISVLDYGVDDHHQPFYTMPLLENAHPLHDVAGTLSYEGKINLLSQMLEALAYLHRRGILHRDLKPSNVLVGENAWVYVLDFGLAVAIDQSAPVAGTLLYMAPEVILRGQIGPAADLFAVGVMAYEIFTGNHPFLSNRTGNILQQILNAEADLDRLAASLSTTMPQATQVLPETGDDATGIASSIAADQLQASSFEGTTVAEIKNRPTPLLDASAVPHQPQRQTGRFAAIHPLVDIVDHLLVKDPAQRYQAADVVIGDLRGLMGESLSSDEQVVRESYLQAARFVGRKDELDKLKAALVQVLHPADESSPDQPIGNAWLVGGESGVGKSRLLNELRIQALASGALVLRGQEMAETGLLYHVWREPLRRLVLAVDVDDTEASFLKLVVPDIDRLIGRPTPALVALDGQTGQKQLVTTILGLFARLPVPAVLLVEDLHWANESLVILKQLVQRVHDLRLLIIGTYRNDERPHLPEELPAMTVMPLARFGEANITELSAAMLGEAGRQTEVLNLLQRESGGNIFFLVETVRALAEEAGRLDRVGSQTLPDRIMTGGIQAILERRLQRVPEWGQPWLRLAAVVGRQIEVPVLQHCMGSDGDIHFDTWLQVCGEAAVLEVQDGAWRFAHDKLREWVLENLASDQRPMLHRQAAEAIETVYSNTKEHAPRLVYLWGQAVNLAKEAHAADIAADFTFEIGNYQDTIQHLQRLLVLVPQLPPANGAASLPSERTIRHRLGNAYLQAGDYTNAETEFNQSLALSEVASDKKASGIALLGLGDVDLARGHFDEAALHFENARQIVELQDDWKLKTAITSKLGILSAQTGKLDQALTYFQRSYDDLQIEANDAYSIAQALMNIGIVYKMRGDLATAQTYYQQSLDVHQRFHHPAAKARLLMNMANVAAGMQHKEQAILHYQESLSICRKTGPPQLVAQGLYNLGLLYFAMGDDRLAEIHLQECLAIVKATNADFMVANTAQLLGEVYQHRGELERARQYYLQVLEISQAHHIVDHEAGAYSLLGEVAMAMQDHAAAHDYLENALRLFEGLQGHLDVILITMADQAMNFMALDNPDAAKAILIQLIERGPSQTPDGARATLLVACAKWWIGVGKIAEAATLLEYVQQWERSDAPMKRQTAALLAALQPQLTAEIFATALEQAIDLDADAQLQVFLEELTASN